MCHRPLRPTVLRCACLMAALGASIACSMGAAQAQEGAQAGANASGSVAVRDRVTGQLRAPTAAELRALRPTPAPGTAQTGPQATQPVVRADGTVAVSLGEAGMVYSVATRGADGKIKEHCVTGPAAAGQAVTSPTQPKEHGHEDR